MTLTGTARGENLLLLIEDAEAQAKTFYGPNIKFKIAFTDAIAEREAETWGGATTRTAFVAGFEASRRRRQMSAKCVECGRLMETPEGLINGQPVCYLPFLRQCVDAVRERNARELFAFPQIIRHEKPIVSPLMMQALTAEDQKFRCFAYGKRWIIMRGLQHMATADRPAMAFALLRSCLAYGKAVKR